MALPDYANFDLEITRLAKGKYQARVIDSPAGEAKAEFKRPFSDLELENFILKIGRTRSGTRSLNSPEMQAAESFGKKLFENVFKDSVRECLTSSIHQIDRNEISGLRLRLRLVGVPELADLPWEYLYHSTFRRFIVLSTQTPIIRYTDLPHPVLPLTVTSPLRLLIMVSGPSDLPRLDYDQEKAKIQRALKDLAQRGLIAVEWLENATLSALQQRLRKGPVHIFHFIGHGGWDRETQDGLLLFEDENGRGRRVTANNLGTILRDHKSMRLVVLNACEGGRASPTDPFAGVAGTLVQQGIPAVLAMQFEITDTAAIELAQVFYESLADGYSAEAALAEARKSIYASGNDVEWGTPVLYLRAPDGRLFDLVETKVPVFENDSPPPVNTGNQANQGEHETPVPDDIGDETVEIENAHQADPASQIFAKVSDEEDLHADETMDQINYTERETINDFTVGINSTVHPELEEFDPGSGKKGKRERITPGNAGKLHSVILFQDYEASRWGVAFSPGGSMVATGSANEVIPVWQINEAAALLRTIEGHTAPIFGVQFSPDSSKLASASADKTVRLWRALDGAILNTLEGHTKGVKCVAFSPDGSLLASGSDDQTVRVWQAADGALVTTLKGHTKQINGVCFSPDGSCLASCSGGDWSGGDATVRLWKMPNGTPGNILAGHTGSVRSVVFSPDGELLASASADKTVRLWRASDGALLNTLEGHTSWARCVAFSTDGQVLVSCSDDGTMKLWLVNTGEFIADFQGFNEGWAQYVTFSKDGELLAYVTSTGTVRLWGIPTEQECLDLNRSRTQLIRIFAGRVAALKAEEDRFALQKLEQEILEQEKAASELPDQPVVEFENMWYRTESTSHFWLQYDDTGKLIVYPDALEYHGKKYPKIRITGIKSVSVREFSSPPNWVKVEYGEGKKRAVASFAPGGLFGFQGYFYDSKIIRDAIQKLVGI